VRGKQSQGSVTGKKNKMKQKKTERRKIKAILAVSALKPLKSLSREVIETSLLKPFQN
jgi:hypothetical protein